MIILFILIGFFSGLLTYNLIQTLPVVVLEERQLRVSQVLKPPSYAKDALLFQLGFAAIFGLSTVFFGLSLHLMITLIIASIAIACFFVDFNHYILPDQLTLSLLWIGLLSSTLPIFISPAQAIWGASFGWGILWLTNSLYSVLRKREGIFPGDFKLNAAIGACFGVSGMFVILFFTLLLIIVTNIYQVVKNRAHLQKELPFGAFASIVVIVAAFLRLYSASLG